MRERFDASVARHLADSPCDVDSASASLSRLTKCVTDAARETLPVKRSQRVRKREVSQRSKLLFEERRRNFHKMKDRERHEATRAITVSSRDDFRHYVHSVLDDMEAAESVGNLHSVQADTHPRPQRLPNKLQPLEGRGWSTNYDNDATAE